VITLRLPIYDNVLRICYYDFGLKFDIIRVIC